MASESEKTVEDTPEMVITPEGDRVRRIFGWKPSDMSVAHAMATMTEWHTRSRPKRPTFTFDCHHAQEMMVDGTLKSVSRHGAAHTHLLPTRIDLLTRKSKGWRKHIRTNKGRLRS